jgi:glycosyltransferase involved in cell wall biosynthesis
MSCKNPLFSIIVPTYNRPSQLAGCLESLLALDYPKDRFEIIVVDDGGEISPERTVQEIERRMHVQLIRQDHSGPAAARNSAAKKACGKFLAFTDDDCLVSPNWLALLERKFAADPNCAIGGRTVNLLTKNRYSVASQSLIDSVYEYYNGNPEQAKFFASNNISVPLKEFRLIGGFDKEFKASEDRDFCRRWIKHDYRMVYLPELIIYHANRLTFRKFWKQHFNYGQGAFLFWRSSYPVQRKRERLEVFNFYYNIFSRPFRDKKKHSAVAILLLLLWSQVASAQGFAYKWIKLRNPYSNQYSSETKKTML